MALLVVHETLTVQVLAPASMVQLAGAVRSPVVVSGAAVTVTVTDRSGVVCPFPVHWKV